MNWLWVNGWGVESRELKSLAVKYFPSISHTVIFPERLDFIAKDFDHVIGWSWGGYRILEFLIGVSEPEVLPKISLIAPFLAFSREEELGGKCSRFQVNYLKRWMERNPVAALEDFYQRAGVPFETPSVENGNITFWTSQLKAMARDKLDLQKVKSALEKSKVRILVGECDSLVDSSWIVHNLGASSIPNVGHSVEYFLKYVE